LIAPLDGVGLDRKIPFAERHVTVQALGNGLIVVLGDSDTRFMNWVRELLTSGPLSRLIKSVLT
jgi:hypothetical protein